jgi:hypothetical protein
LCRRDERFAEAVFREVEELHFSAHDLAREHGLVLADRGDFYGASKGLHIDRVGLLRKNHEVRDSHLAFVVQDRAAHAEFGVVGMGRDDEPSFGVFGDLGQGGGEGFRQPAEIRCRGGEAADEAILRDDFTERGVAIAAFSEAFFLLARFLQVRRTELNRFLPHQKLGQHDRIRLHPQLVTARRGVPLLFRRFH